MQFFRPVGRKMPIWQSTNKYVDKKIQFLRSHDGQKDGETVRWTDGKSDIHKMGAPP